MSSLKKSIIALACAVAASSTIIAAQAASPGATTQESPRQAVCKKPTAARKATGRAWLGVQLEQVPPPVASQLQIEGGGLMVRNVFVDSPADGAGIVQFDVIVAIDGQKVSDNVNEFADAVRKKNVKDTITLTLYRHGEKMDITTQLSGRKGNWRDLAFKYEDEPEAPFEFRGRILHHGPEGWRLEDLGAAPFGKEIRDRLHRSMKRYTARATEPITGYHVNQQGEVLLVRREADGTVVVKRYRQQDGEASADTMRYRDVQDLKTNDPKAYELLQAARANREQPEIEPPTPGTSPPAGWRESFDQRLDTLREQLDKTMDALSEQSEQAKNAVKEKWPDIQKQYGQTLDELADQIEKLRSEYDVDGRWQEWRERFFRGPFNDVRPDEPIPVGPPKVRFETDADGQITVHIRKGDNELTRTFPSETAMRERAPKLHDRYQALLDTPP